MEIRASRPAEPAHPLSASSRARLKEGKVAVYSSAITSPRLVAANPGRATAGARPRSGRVEHVHTSIT